MKQTAVEWLVENAEDFFGGLLAPSIIDQAKKMEKQQIMDAHGNKTKKSAGVTNYIYTLTGEQYYNETFKSE